MNCVAKIFNRKTLFWIILVCSFVSISPVLYCGLFDYANGDDLIGASVAHQAYANGASLGEYFSAVIHAVIENYYSWGGNFASTFIWYAFEPSIWGESVYRVVPFLALLSILCLLYCAIYFGKRYLSFSGMSSCLIAIPVVTFIIHFAPSIRALLFWWTGVVVYIFPIGLMCLSLIWIDKYLEKKRNRYLFFLSFSMVYIGGAGYFSAIVFVEIFAVILLSQVFFRKKKIKEYIALSIPFLILLICFLISFVAPGNASRASSSEVDISISLSKILYTICECFLVGSKDIVMRLFEIRPLFLLFLSIPLMTWFFLDFDNIKIEFSHPIFVGILLLLLYFSSYAPMLFAGVEVSGGGLNDIFIFFITIVSLLLVYVTGYFKRKLLLKKGDSVFLNLEWINKKICIPFGMFSILFFLIFGKYLIGDSSGYMCFDFIKSGALYDFNEQMQERISILQAEGKNVILPQMNDEQGPFMHMPLTENPSAYPNHATKLFYGKDSVIAIPREEWIEKYGYR